LHFILQTPNLFEQPDPFYHQGVKNVR